MKLSIIIVSYNTKDFLDRCLSSIYENTLSKRNYEVIVVDNNSKDNTIQDLSKKYTHAKWIRLKKNSGFAKANNIGLRKSGETDYILFLNPDTILEPKAFEKILQFMNDNPKVGIVGPYVKLPSGKIDDACHRGFPTPWNALTHFSGLGKLLPGTQLFNGYHLGYQNLTKPHEIDACAGAAMLVRRECGKEIGWWDEDYFWYGEDIDFCYRAKETGWKVMFYPNTKVIHFKGVSGGIKKDSQQISTADKKTRQRAQKARFDAMRIFYKKHYVDKYPSIVTWGVLNGIKIYDAINRITTA
jgi:GT2 family glycosyltransferase